MLTPISSLNSKSKNRKNVRFGLRPIPKTISAILQQKLLDAKRADIFVHISPKVDADAAVSAVQLEKALKGKGIEVHIHSDGENVNDLTFSPIHQDMTNSQSKSDVSLLLDVNELSRIDGTPQENPVVIDHHVDRGNIKSDYKYIDETARSCSGIIYKFLKGWNIKCSKEDLQNFLYGMLDDYQKSKLIKIEGFKLIKLHALKKDKNSKKVLQEVQRQLKKKDRNAVYKRLDVISTLNNREKELRKKLFSDIQVSPNGKLAYVIIEPDNKLWDSLGMDNHRNSTILRDLRTRLINGIQKDKMFTNEQKKRFKNLKGAVVFYKSTDSNGNYVYQISMHTKKSTDALKVLDNVKTEWNKYIERNGKNIEIQGGGHENRAGGRILSSDRDDIEAYINCFLKASESIK